MFFLNLLFRRNDRRHHTANSFAHAFTSNIKSADGRIDLLTPARFGLSASPIYARIPCGSIRGGDELRRIDRGRHGPGVANAATALCTYI